MQKKKKQNTKMTLWEHPDGSHSFLPFWLPTGRSGKWSIDKQIVPEGTELTVVSMRNAIFMGLPHSKIKVNRETVIHHLYEGESLWMSDRPQEIEQAYRQLAKAEGKVLVGGLGIGLAAAVLHANPKVRHITVIEKEQDVIKLVAPYLPQGKIITVEGELFGFLREAKASGFKYDFAFYDIWTPTSQFILFETLMPLRQASKDIVPQHMIEMWNEDEVIGQVAMSINNWVGPEREGIRDMMFKQGGGNPFEKSKEEFAKWATFNREAYPFLAWVHDTKPDPVHAMVMAREYLEDLKDAVAFDNLWARYVNYGGAADRRKEFNAKIQEVTESREGSAA